MYDSRWNSSILREKRRVTGMFQENCWTPGMTWMFVRFRCTVTWNCLKISWPLWRVGRTSISTGSLVSGAHAKIEISLRHTIKTSHQNIKFRCCDWLISWLGPITALDLAIFMEYFDSVTQALRRRSDDMFATIVCVFTACARQGTYYLNNARPLNPNEKCIKKGI